LGDLGLDVRMNMKKSTGFICSYGPLIEHDNETSDLRMGGDFLAAQNSVLLTCKYLPIHNTLIFNKYDGGQGTGLD
jgi:hypothetical protein